MGLSEIGNVFWIFSLKSQLIGKVDQDQLWLSVNAAFHLELFSIIFSCDLCNIYREN